MCDRIFYINSNLSSVPCEASASAPPPPTPHPTPAYYHVVYRGNGESRMRWHGETYCLVGGYRAYGDAPIATPAKAKEEEPAPRRASKRRRSQEESHKDGRCPSPKIPRLRRGSKRSAQRSLLVEHLCGEDKPRAAETAKASSALTTGPLRDDLFCLSLFHPGARITSPGQEQGASEVQLKKSSSSDPPALCSVLSSPFVGRRKNSLPCASRGGAQRRERMRRDLTAASVLTGFGSESPPATTSTSQEWLASRKLDK